MEKTTTSQASIESWEVLDLLSHLVEKSLVVYDEDGSGAGRYRFLETVRQYVGDKIDAAEAESLRARHREWFTQLAEQASPGLTGPDCARWLKQLEDEHENFRSALDLKAADAPAVEQALRLAGGLWRFWEARAHITEARERLDRLLRLCEGNTVLTTGHARALVSAGRLAYTYGDYPAATGHFEQARAVSRNLNDGAEMGEALLGLGNIAHFRGEDELARDLLDDGLALFREAGALQGVARALNTLAVVALRREDYSAAHSLMDESLAIRRRLNDPIGTSVALSTLGMVFHAQGHYSTAEDNFEEALAIAREVGEMDMTASLLLKLGEVAVAQGDIASGRARYRESLVMLSAMGSNRTTIRCLEHLSKLSAAQKEYERAARLLAAAEKQRVDVGLQEGTRQAREMTAARGVLGEKAFAAAWRKGQAMTLDEAVKYALEEDPAP